MRKESITQAELKEIKKVCSKCGVAKPLTAFYKNKRYSFGVIGRCIPCFLLENNARKKRDRANPDFKIKELAYKKAYRLRNVEQRKQYMAMWREKNAAKNEAYREANKERARKYNQEYDKKNRASKLARTRKRQTAQMRRTPVVANCGALL